MPLAPKADLKEYANIVGETEFAIPDSDDVEMVKLHIYYAAPIFIDDKLNVSHLPISFPFCYSVNDEILLKLPSFGAEKTMLIVKV